MISDCCSQLELIEREWIWRLNGPLLVWGSEFWRDWCFWLKVWRWTDGLDFKVGLRRWWADGWFEWWSDEFWFLDLLEIAKRWVMVQGVSRNGFSVWERVWVWWSEIGEVVWVWWMDLIEMGWWWDRWTGKVVMVSGWSSSSSDMLLWLKSSDVQSEVVLDDGDKFFGFMVGRQSVNCKRYHSTYCRVVSKIR